MKNRRSNAERPPLCCGEARRLVPAVANVMVSAVAMHGIQENSRQGRAAASTGAAAESQPEAMPLAGKPQVHLGV